MTLICKNCGKKENNEEDNKPEDTKKDETTSDDKKLPQTGLSDILAVVTSVAIANAGASFIMLKKKEN